MFFFVKPKTQVLSKTVYLQYSFDFSFFNGYTGKDDGRELGNEEPNTPFDSPTEALLPPDNLLSLQLDCVPSCQKQFFFPQTFLHLLDSILIDCVWLF